MDARRAAAVAAIAAVVLLAVGEQGFGAQIPRATCLDCHEKEGMTYATVVVTPFLELEQNSTEALEVVVANPWLHDITGVTATVALKSPTLMFETHLPFEGSKTGPLAQPPAGSPELALPFEIAAGATGLVVRMTEVSGPQSVDADLFLERPDGEEQGQATADGLDANPPSTQIRTTESLAFDSVGVANLGTGAFTAVARLSFVQGIPSLGAPTPVTLDVHVFYNATTVQTQRVVETFKQPDSITIPFQIIGAETGPAALDVAVTVTAHYVHPKGIGAQDDGNETVVSHIEFQVGQSTRLGEQTALSTVIPRNWNLIATTWGEATGWIGTFLIPISLVLGGAFGRRNVLWMNKVARNGRVRVLWHNAVSFILLFFTVGHIVLFLIEPRYLLSVGLVWGGLATLALLGLAVTGIWWRGISRRWGYHNWRALHISMAVGFVALVVVHVLAEGAHFDWARKALGMN